MSVVSDLLCIPKEHNLRDDSTVCARCVSKDCLLACLSIEIISEPHPKGVVSPLAALTHL